MKRVIPIALITILVLALAAYILMSYSFRSSNSQNYNSAIQSPTPGPVTGLEKAMESGEPSRCTIVNGANRIIYQIKGKKIRTESTYLDANAQDNQNTTSINTINDGIYMYTWDSFTKQGAKITIPTPEERKKMSSNINNSSAPLSSPPSLQSQDTNTQNKGYMTSSCEKIEIDDSIFIPPSDINFVVPIHNTEQSLPTASLGPIPTTGPQIQ